MIRVLLLRILRLVSDMLFLSLELVKDLFEEVRGRHGKGGNGVVSSKGLEDRVRSVPGAANLSKPSVMVQPCSSFDRRSIFRHYGTKGVSKLASSGYILHM